MQNKILNTKLCGIELQNPVIAASGTFGFGAEYKKLYEQNKENNLASLFPGAICSKGLTLNPKSGNSGTRVYESSSGILNSIGLENPGLDYFITNILPVMKSYNTVTIANAGGGSEEDYIKIIEALSKTDVDMIELNISCPNVKCGGMAFGIKSNIAYNIVKDSKQVSSKPLIVKLSPNAENISEMAWACQEAGADALSLVNTFQAMAIDINKRKAVFDNVYAGLSGAAIKPIALRMVHQVCKVVKIPVIGIGGIANSDDAIEFIMAGATLVQVGTANFSDPFAIPKIIDGISNYMEKNNINSLESIRGII